MSEADAALRIAAFVGRVDFTHGPVPAVVCDAGTREVRMVGAMTREALEATLDTGLAHFYSRSRNRTWKKGATSGAVQRVHRVWLSCDQDALVLEVEQVGDVTCHRGTRTCFTQGLLLTAEPVEAMPPASPPERMVPVTVGAPASQPGGLLQQPLDSLVLETHVRPLLTAYQALLRLDDPDSSPFGDLRDAGRATFVPRVREAVGRLAAACRPDPSEPEILAGAADVWAWSALTLLREDSADAAAMAAAIAQGYFSARLAPSTMAAHLEDAAGQLDSEGSRLELAAAILSLLEGCGAVMRCFNLRPYAFLDHDRRQMLERRL